MKCNPLFKYLSFQASRAASYNNPEEMFPSAAKLFNGMTLFAGTQMDLSGKGWESQVEKTLKKCIY